MGHADDRELAQNRAKVAELAGGMPAHLGPVTTTTNLRPVVAPATAEDVIVAQETLAEDVEGPLIP